MCGLWGVSGPVPMKSALVAALAINNKPRGSHSTGIAGVNLNADLSDGWEIYKNTNAPEEFVIDDEFFRITEDYHTIIGHNRQATNGAHTVENAHPWLIGHTLGCHNGIVNGEEGILELLEEGEEPPEFDVDSQYLIWSLDNFGHYNWASGKANVVYVDMAAPCDINLIRAGNPLSIVSARNEDGATFFAWSSTFDHLEKAMNVIGYGVAKKYGTRRMVKYTFDDCTAMRLRRDEMCLYQSQYPPELMDDFGEITMSQWTGYTACNTTKTNSNSAYQNSSGSYYKSVQGRTGALTGVGYTSSRNDSQVINGISFHPKEKEIGLWLTPAYTIRSRFDENTKQTPLTEFIASKLTTNECEAILRVHDEMVKRLGSAECQTAFHKPMQLVQDRFDFLKKPLATSSTASTQDESQKKSDSQVDGKSDAVAIIPIKEGTPDEEVETEEFMVSGDSPLSAEIEEDVDDYTLDTDFNVPGYLGFRSEA